jgi:hypothetical protein
MYVIHAIRRNLRFLYGNRLSSDALFSAGSHTGTGAPVQYPFWGGVSSLQPARSAVCVRLEDCSSPLMPSYLLNRTLDLLRESANDEARKRRPDFM